MQLAYQGLNVVVGVVPHAMCLSSGGCVAFVWPGSCSGSVGHSAVRLWADIPHVLGRGAARG